ncbi:hypothetical protein HAX54_000449, partial [Datura stramonium]|nr:hypothetical protein [Datura stramonium]
MLSERVLTLNVVDFTVFGMYFARRRPLVNCRSCPAKCRMKRSSGFRASGHRPRPTLHRHFMSQDQQNSNVLLVDTCVPSILFLSE